MATKAYHHGNLRAALLERAEQTLRDRGVGGLSLRELARDVGVSHAAPRRHFADRQALLDALAEDGFDRLGSELERAVAGAGPEWRARLIALATAYVRFASEHAALLDVMFTVKHTAEPVSQAADRAFAVPLELFREGDMVDGHGGTIFFATLQGLGSLHNNGMLGDVPLEELVAEAVERALR